MDIGRNLYIAMPALVSMACLQGMDWMTTEFALTFTDRLQGVRAVETNPVVLNLGFENAYVLKFLFVLAFALLSMFSRSIWTMTALIYGNLVSLAVVIWNTLGIAYHVNHKMGVAFIVAACLTALVGVGMTLRARHLTNKKHFIPERPLTPTRRTNMTPQLQAQRTRCPLCDIRVPVHQDGTMSEHRMKPSAGWAPLCDGSGETPTRANEMFREEYK